MQDEILPLELVGWKGFITIKAYINCECRLHYLRLLGVNVSQFGNKILYIFSLYKLYLGYLLSYKINKFNN